MFNSFADTTCNKIIVLIQTFFIYNLSKKVKKRFQFVFHLGSRDIYSETVSPCNMEDNDILLKNKFSFTLFNLTVESFQWNWSFVY